MARFQQSTTFNAAPSTVYGYLTDITKHAEWSSHGLTVEKASEGPVAVGSTFNTVGKLMGTTGLLDGDARLIGEKGDQPDVVRVKGLWLHPPEIHHAQQHVSAQ